MRWTIARLVALTTAYLGVSLLERVAYAAAAEAAAAKLAAAVADEALFAHLTGPCGCPDAADVAEDLAERAEQPTPHVCQVCDYPLTGHGASC